MANYNIIKSEINSKVRTNGTQAVTGAILNGVLRGIVDTLTSGGYQFGGIVAPGASFNASDANVAFLAFEAGTYPNHGGAVLDGETYHLLAYYNGSWTNTDLKVSTAPINRDFGHYATSTNVTLSKAVAGKYVDKDTAQEVSNASYGISNPISLAAGDILLVPSSSAVLAACSVVSRKVTNTYDKAIIYTYTYDELGRIDTATADYSSALVYTAHYASDEATTPDYWTIGGDTVETLPATHSVTESFYVPLVKQSVAGMPSGGYYVYLAPTSMEVVISAYNATVEGGVAIKVGWGIFKNIATNFVGFDKQHVIAEALATLFAAVEGIQDKLENGIGSLKVNHLRIGRRLDGLFAEGPALVGAGAPSAAIIPESWDYDTFGEWTGIPQYIGQEYFDSVNKIWYKAGGTSAVSDWIRISNA